MSRKTTSSSLGALHPILFFVVIYGISLFLAFFVCSTVYYSINESDDEITTEVAAQDQYELNSSNTVTALR
jgi:predicted membrane channel-forming protein YqfA (hemolysin III family)